MAYGDYQLEIYFQGLSGVLPKLPMAFAELEAKAQAAMSPSMWSYVAGGAGDERTQRVNATAFENWGLMPRMFVGALLQSTCYDVHYADPSRNGQTSPSGGLWITEPSLIGPQAAKRWLDATLARVAATRQEARP